VTATITTVIPTFRRPRLLRRALRSVLRQTRQDFLVCVYDNASGDETESVVAEAAAGDPRVVYFKQPENIGGARNFLFGMQRIETPFFSFLSDDDVLLPHFYETAMAGFDTWPAAMMSVASTIEVTASGELRYVPLSRWGREGLFEPPDGAMRMVGNRHPTWTTILFRQEVLERVGTLDLDVGAPSDLDFELRIALRFPIVVSMRPCGAYVSHPDSGSTTETAGIAAGYDVMRRKIVADDRIDAGVRRRFDGLLTRQLRMKLLEIWVKSLVRGDDDAALAAAVAMRERYGPRIGGWALELGWRWCTRVAALRSALRWIEGRRLGARANASERGMRHWAALAAIREALAS
jgi:GT2 family glycosyltransferase